MPKSEVLEAPVTVCASHSGSKSVADLPLLALHSVVLFLNVPDVRCLSMVCRHLRGVLKTNFSLSPLRSVRFGLGCPVRQFFRAVGLEPAQARKLWVNRKRRLFLTAFTWRHVRSLECSARSLSRGVPKLPSARYLRVKGTCSSSTVRLCRESVPSLQYLTLEDCNAEVAPEVQNALSAFRPSNVLCKGPPKKVYERAVLSPRWGSRAKRHKRTA